MNHILVMPMRDPQQMLFPHLERITPVLKQVFAGIVVSVDPGESPSLLADDFYQSLEVDPGLPLGGQFHRLYDHAAQINPPESVLHLCFADRLAFQVESDHRSAFLASINSLQAARLPLLFQRSPAAWATHPRSYREIEAAISMVGRWTCGRDLDFAWCHLAVTAGRLAQVLPAVCRPDLSMMAELILSLRDELHTEDVDWLSWEDPFILGRAADELRAEREASPAETRKRLAYALPMMELLRSRM